MRVILTILSFGVFFLVFFGIINVFGSKENNTLTGIVAIIAVVIGVIAFHTFFDKGEEKINDLKENIENSKIANEHHKIYLETKNNSNYLSDEFILEQLIDNNIHIMKRLAFEEVLVGRGILNSSPTHEKLALIRNQLKL